jgi:hypothetical protein
MHSCINIEYYENKIKKKRDEFIDFLLNTNNNDDNNLER